MEILNQVGINLTTSDYILLILVQLWDLVWKGVALWKAARNKQPNWFFWLLIINSAGLLPIIYIFYFSDPTKKFSFKAKKLVGEHKKKKAKSE